MQDVILMLKGKRELYLTTLKYNPDQKYFADDIAVLKDTQEALMYYVKFERLVFRKRMLNVNYR